MCGIIGLVGMKSPSPILPEGLRRLEYRGYDSAGVAVLCDADLLVRKKQGKIDEGLARVLHLDSAALSTGTPSGWKTRYSATLHNWAVARNARNALLPDRRNRVNFPALAGMLQVAIHLLSPLTGKIRKKLITHLFNRNETK